MYSIRGVDPTVFGTLDFWDNLSLFIFLGRFWDRIFVVFRGGFLCIDFFFALGETSFFTYDMIPWAKATIEHLHIPRNIYQLHTDMLSKHTNLNSKSMHGAMYLLRNLGSRPLSVNARTVYILVGTYQSFNEIVLLSLVDVYQSRFREKK